MTVPVPPTDKAESSAIKARLDRLRRAERPKQIVKALEAIDADTEDLKLEQLPDLLRMIRVLINLQELVEVYGIARYFMEWPAPLGTYAPDAVAWCRLIGAKRQATYLKRALSLFPGGRPPADGAAALLAVDRIEKRAPNAFLDLEKDASPIKRVVVEGWRGYPFRLARVACEGRKRWHTRTGSNGDGPGWDLRQSGEQSVDVTRWRVGLSTH